MRVKEIRQELVNVFSVHTEVDREDDGRIYYYTVVGCRDSCSSVRYVCLRAFQDITAALDFCEMIDSHLKDGTEVLDVSMVGGVVSV